MDKQKRLDRLAIQLARIEKSFVAHNEVAKHPDFGSPASLTFLFPCDCMLGSAESALNMTIAATANLHGKKLLAAARRGTKWIKYGLMREEFERLQIELGKEEV